MPELPEVETVVRGLAPVLTGQRFARVELRRPDLRFPLPELFAERLEGRRVACVARRAKYILVHLDGGEVLAVHLGMTGRFSVDAPKAEDAGPARAHAAQLGDYTFAHGRDARHDHVVFTLRNGAMLTYNDARRFGYMTLIAAGGLGSDPFLAGLGVEPLGPDLSAAYLAARACGRKTDLKAFLMDQRIVAGLGNIYVCEAMFRAGLDPFLPAARLASRTGKPLARAQRLVLEIKAVLEEAIRAGGSTLRDYQDTAGNAGRFQRSHFAYGREGEACLRAGCRGTVRRKTQGGRSTFYCAACQR